MSRSPITNQCSNISRAVSKRIQLRSSTLTWTIIRNMSRHSGSGLNLKCSMALNPGKTLCSKCLHQSARLACRTVAATRKWSKLLPWPRLIGKIHTLTTSCSMKMKSLWKMWSWAVLQHLYSTLKGITLRRSKPVISVLLCCRLSLISRTEFMSTLVCSNLLFTKGNSQQTYLQFWRMTQQLQSHNVYKS